LIGEWEFVPSRAIWQAVKIASKIVFKPYNLLMNSWIKCGFLSGALLTGLALHAQQNIDEILRDRSNNYYTIKQKADSFFARLGTVGTGWKEFKRWEFLVKNNMGPNGELYDFETRNREALTRFVSENPAPLGTEAGVSNWVPFGQPNPTIEPGDAQNGVGALRCLEFSGSDIWVGTPGGGLWFGDFLGGSVYSWSAKTDGLPNLAIQDMMIAPTNANIMYAITGAVGGASGYRSTGVLKSTDGGNNWFTTGLTFPASGGERGYKIVVSPTSSNIVWACTTDGLYRTTDGGTTWNFVTYATTVGGTQFNFSLETFDLEYQPGSTTIMYATSPGFLYKSTDGGITFLRLDRATAGLPTTGGTRIEIAVTNANSAYVYLLYGNGNVYQALYRSTNNGSTFSSRSTIPNILGSQAWRNIAIDVSPTNVNDVYVGGLDVYKSTDGGVNWTAISNWTSTSTTNFCHADIFELKCDATYLYAATDGGLYRMTRSTDTWVSLNNNMQIAQIYRFSVDPTAAAGFFTSGLQDNGSYRNNGSTYLNIGGADGMETIIKPSNTNVIYLSSQDGPFRRSDDGGSTSVSIFNVGTANGVCGCTESAQWTTPAVLRPGNDNHIYIGYENIYFNTTSGTGAWSWINTTFTSPILSLEFAPSNNTILYATQGSTIRRFNLSGGVWSGTTINGTLPALSAITEIAVDPDNSSHVLISVGGYNATQKVYETFNANAASPTWTSIVRNLPNVPVNCLVMNNDAANSIYIGTDIGVFVTNDNRVNWIMYNNGLPTTRVYDLEINTAAAVDKIFAATFGRGVFSAETYTGCDASATLSGSVTGLEYTETSTSITSTQFISGGNGTSVGYNSGGSIILTPGFEAKAGIKLEAYIQGCTGSGTPPRPLRMATGIPVKKND
jgi:photosystem II stability/assembly factor-like uncharacterized protein